MQPNRNQVLIVSKEKELKYKKVGLVLNLLTLLYHVTNQMFPELYESIGTFLQTVKPTVWIASLLFLGNVGQFLYYRKQIKGATK